jgi:lysyl-tRNA synthetase, class II
VAEEERGIDSARLEKLQALVAAGVAPYGGRFERTARARDLRAAFTAWEGRRVRAAGRIRAIRGHGAMTFADLEDESGSLQAQFTRDRLGAEDYAHVGLLDLGDIVGVEGSLFRTRVGEPTVAVDAWRPLAKALRPVPTRFYGLKDTDLRYRQRYLDLIANPEVRHTFRTRSRIVARVRRFLDDRGFLEVETPELVALAGGAAARPFHTHHNALDLDLSLRISIELHLKRLLVGGFERVYEIGRVFRNEGIDTRHNPEFSLLELYQAYADLRDIMALVEALVHDLAVHLTGSAVVPYRGEMLDTTPPWPRLSYMEELKKATGVDWMTVGDDAEARAVAARLNVAVEPTASRGQVVDKLTGQFVEPTLLQPCFLIDFPVAISPLAKEHPDRPGVADRFEAFAGGRELANAFSELNDPLEQRRRFEAQVEERRLTHDDEIPDPDEDFLLALEYGMPPAGGLGIGVERLVMLLTDSDSIRDGLLFPLQRPIAEGARAGAPAGEGR